MENKQKRKYQATLVVVGILKTINSLLPFDTFGYSIDILTNIFPMTILTFSFVRVRRLLMKYQEDKYKDIKTALWLYYIFDMIGYAL